MRTTVPYARCWSPAPAVILNVSRMGVGIETLQSFRPGDSVFLTTRLANASHRILGHVRWCRQIATAGGSSSRVFHVGIAVTPPLEEGWLSALPRPFRKTRLPSA